MWSTQLFIPSLLVFLQVSHTRVDLLKLCSMASFQFHNFLNMITTEWLSGFKTKTSIITEPGNFIYNFCSDLISLNVCFCSTVCIVLAWSRLIALGHVFVSCLYHDVQTYRFRRCSMAAAGALNYPKTKPTKMSIKKNFTYFILLYRKKIL